MSIDRVALGRTGIKVSEITLGTARFGRDPAEGGATRDTAHALIDQYLDAGGNFIDTANVYSDGESERVIGDWLADNDRDDVVIASKIGLRGRDEPANVGGLHRRHLRRELETSLERLGTEYLDVLFVHRWDEHTPVDEFMRTLTSFVDEGLVNYLGASHGKPNAWNVVHANELAERQGLEPFRLTQMRYSLIRRELERNFIPMCEKFDLGVMPYRALAAGFLTGKYERDTEPPANSRAARSEQFRDRYLTERNFDILDTVREIATEVDATPGQVALAWLLAQETVSTTIVGAYSSAQLEENLGGAAVELADDQVERLNSTGDG